MKINLSLVIPTFNEEEVIEETHRRIRKVMDSLNKTYEIIYINDGSFDNTKKLIENITLTDKAARLISFSRNFGHQAAVFAGIAEAKGDAVIILDADLQDPPELIPDMVLKWEEGFAVVNGRRIKREGENIFKKLSAKIYYRLLNLITTTKIPVDVGDFRLLDRKVCDVIKNLPDKNPYIRGLVSWAGFKQTEICYERSGRFAGETKYSLKKMLRLAGDGIVSFSARPLKLSAYLGAAITLLSLAGTAAFFVRYIMRGGGSLVPFMFLALFLLNGLILIILGIMGEYIGRIFDQAKNRPLYIIEEKKGYENEG